MPTKTKPKPAVSCPGGCGKPISFMASVKCPKCKKDGYCGPCVAEHLKGCSGL